MAVKDMMKSKKNALEIKEKETRLRELMSNESLDGIVLSMRENFAWLTCGGFSGVDKSAQPGVADILITSDKKYLITSEIEKYRFADEEIFDQGFGIVSHDWIYPNTKTIAELIDAKSVGSDTGICGTKNIYREIVALRYSLTEGEVKRIRAFAQIATTALFETCMEVQRGDSEFKISANVTRKLIEQGAQLPVCLVASDERIAKYRHPIPTAKTVDKYVMIVTGAEMGGLILAMTRIVSFGEISDELKNRHAACTKIDADLIANTEVGANVSQIFEIAQIGYEKAGYHDEWKLHHQGGALSYSGRDYLASAICKEAVRNNQLFAWNPSISGTKSEDTYLVTNEGQEILTYMPQWPMLDVKTGNRTIKRPDILVK